MKGLIRSVHVTPGVEHGRNLLRLPVNANPQQMDDMIGTMPLFDPSKPAEPQIYAWILWCGRVKLAIDLEGMKSPVVESAE